MLKCLECGNIQESDESGIDGFCDKCGSEILVEVKEEEDYDYPEYDYPMRGE